MSLSNTAKIKIDSEFQARIPPMIDEERELLEESLKKDGCLDPLRVWDNDGELVLLDGHNRFDICQKLGIEFTTTTINVADRREALNWIIDNQLGRRNLTNSQRKQLRGLRYLNEKEPHGGDRGNQYTKEARDQNDPLAKTAKKIADQTGVSEMTIKRDAQFAQAIDLIQQDTPELAQKILKEEIKPTQKEVLELAQKPTDEKKAIAEEIAGSQGLLEAAENVVTYSDPSNPKIEDFSEPSKRAILADATAKVEAKKGGGSKFNFTNDNIEWAKWTWNPVTGCLHGCKYCYARDIAMRFNSGKGFKPEFHENRLEAPANTPLPAQASTEVGFRNVFVCSMADLFGEWVPQDWIDKVLQVVKENPQWNYLFLTKNPKRLTTIDWPDNAWVGTTVDTKARVKAAEEAFRKVNAKIKFLSCEPLQEQLEFSDMSMFNWIIIGGRSKSTGMEEGQPEWLWVESLIHQARSDGLKIYFKPNLKSRPKEYPQ